ncbi:MAG: hypoxanthine phosphoribosyltransferase [Pirellulales bacterium]|nr:hypoxanthine phosphoribosyltransferase [Pirellulales bacterium]
MKTLLNEEQIRRGVTELASEIESYYGDKSLTIVGILTGSLVLLADLIRLLQLPLRLGLIQAHSYRGAATTPGVLKINSNFLPDVQGRDVLLVDDIFDTGNTLMEVLGQLDELQPNSIRTAVLLQKEGRQQIRLSPQLHRVYDTRRVRGGLRLGLQRHVPKPAAYCCIGRSRG